MILAACDDPGDMRRIERELRTRYEADYRVVCGGSAGAGLNALQRFEEAGNEVPLVLADQQMRGVRPLGEAGSVGEGSVAVKQVLEYLSQI